MVLPRPRSIRTLFILTIVGLILTLSLPLLYSGIRIMDSLVGQYGLELLQSQLDSQVARVERMYQTLARVGLEDSRVHRQEIRRLALKSFAAFHYKKSGRMFVIGADGDIRLFPVPLSQNSRDFRTLFASLTAGRSPVDFQVNGLRQQGVAVYFKPWNSYVGLAMDRDELYGGRQLFVRIHLGLLAVVLIVALLFAHWLHHNLIVPIIQLTRYASRVRDGDLAARPKGRYILELGTLRDDLREMVRVLRDKMRESREQLERIREREQELARLLTSLRASEEKYRAVFNAPDDAIIIHDSRTGALLDVNQGAERMYGYDREALLRMQVSELSEPVAAYGPEAVGERIRQTLETGSSRFEWRARHAGGRVFWVEVALHATRFGEDQVVIAVVRDIDQRKKAELRLAREREQLAVTLRSIGDGVITTDLDGRVVLINRVAEEMTGWTQDEGRGRLLSEVLYLVDERTGDRRPDPARRVLESGQVVEMANHTALIARDGSTLAIADSAAPIIGPGGRIFGAVVVFRDVTEKNRLEQELLKVKKLESVGVLAGGIAHDFNNILAAVQGNISLARTRLARLIPEVDTVDQPLARAERATVQATHLTGQLLTFAKGGEPVRQTASVVEIIRESVEFVLRGSPVDYTLECPPDLWLVDVDPGQISQVIQNIVLNSRQAMVDGGRITIIACNCQGCSDDSELFRDRCVRVDIRDNGPGIPADILDKIFDPYFTTRPDGSGLGLAICHSILDKHGGRISVESTVGRGACFSLLLPVASEESPVRDRDESERQEGGVGSLRILVMDDEAMIREMAAGMLELLGHEVVSVADGEEAIRAYGRALEQGTPFDLVIMDLTIPGGMGGREALVQLRKIDPGVRAVVSSGYANDPVMASFQEHGFAATMAKPYDIDTLRRTLDELFA